MSNAMRLVTVPTTVHDLQTVGGFLFGYGDNEDLAKHFADQVYSQGKHQGIEVDDMEAEDQDMSFEIPCAYILEIATSIHIAAEKHPEVQGMKPLWIKFVKLGRAAMENNENFGDYKELEMN